MDRKRLPAVAIALGATGVVLLAGALALHDFAWPDAIVNAVAPLAPIEPAAIVAEADDPAAVDDIALDAPLGSSLSGPEPLEHRPLIAAAAAPVVAPPGPRLPRDAAIEVSPDCPALLRQQFNRLQTGEPQSLCQFRGKVLLVVNTASYCAYTNQYQGLEALYRKYRGRGLVVVGFPSNDFGGQEPGSNEEIANFCRLTYGVEFPMFEKSSVTSVASNPLFAALAASTGVAPAWNFYKYLVDRRGHAVAVFGSRTKPTNAKLVGVLERLLAERTPEG